MEVHLFHSDKYEAIGSFRNCQYTTTCTDKNSFHHASKQRKLIFYSLRGKLPKADDITNESLTFVREAVYLFAIRKRIGYCGIVVVYLIKFTFATTEFRNFIINAGIDTFLE